MQFDVFYMFCQFKGPFDDLCPLIVIAALCSWCGTWKGSKRCTGCRKALYCSEKHWVIGFFGFLRHFFRFQIATAIPKVHPIFFRGL